MPSYPGGLPVPFASNRLYEPNTTIAEMILRAGQQRAQMQQQMYSGIGDTISQLGQIPGQIQQQKALQARTELETARAKREEERNKREEQSLDRLTKQREIASGAMAGGVLDPEALLDRLTKAGADPDTIKMALDSAKSLTDIKKSYRQSRTDLIANHALEMVPMFGTKLEGPAVQTMLASLKEEGIPDAQLAQIAQQYQQNPDQVKNLALSAIMSSESALKKFNDTYGKQTKVGADEKIVQGLGLPGGGQVIAEGAGKVGTFESYVKGLYGEKPTPSQLENARQRWAQSDEAPGAAPTLTKEGIEVAARMYAKTGEMPPMGMGKAGAQVRQEIINRAAAINPDLDIATAKAEFGANKASLSALQKQTDAVSAFENTASKNAKLLEGVLKDIPDLGTKFLNSPVRAAATQVGSEKMARFNVLLQSVRNEYARIVSNPGLSGVMSDSARKEGDILLSESSTVGQIRTAIKALAEEAKNRHESYSGQLKAIQGRIGGGDSDEGWQTVNGVKVRAIP